LTWFCRICGGQSFRQEKRGVSYEESKEGGFSFRVLLKLGRRATQSGEFNAKVCWTCENIDEEEPEQNVEPIKVDPPRGKTVVLISYTTRMMLIDNGITAQEIGALVTRQYNELSNLKEKIEKRGGNNPCDNGRKGYEFKLRVNDKKIPCWLLLGRYESGMAIRISYNARKGVCH